MRPLYTLVLVPLLALAAVGTTAAQPSSIFPYEYQVRTLANDLQVVVVPTDYPNIVSLYIPVAVGSRNEVEPGKSGFAHFFEHMMFRGTANVSEEEYQQVLQHAGADQNAYTTDDRTVYHITFSAEDLETVIALEADRFQNLEYSESVFRTEALAVLGEYNKNYANPIQKLLEVLRETAFTEHTYRHTTMGFLEDIEVMPEQMEYSRVFFDRFYRPEYTTVIVVGDVVPDEVFSIVERHWGGWERGSYVSDVPVEPPPAGPQFAHVPWDAPTLPWLIVAFRSPGAYGEDDRDVRALDLLTTYAFGSASDLFQRLVVSEQKVDALFGWQPDNVDPYLTLVAARLKDADDIAYVRDAIQETIAGLRQRGVDAERLDDIKSNLRYSFAQAMDSSPAIAGALASFVANTRDVETINHVYDTFAQLTPEDLQKAANRYLVDQGMTVVTLAHEELSSEAASHGSVDRHLSSEAAAGSAARDDEPPAGAGPAGANTLAEPGRTPRRRAVDPAAEGSFETLILESASPLIDFRFLFLTGAADDPQGQEGLAQLTAMMVADAGSRTMPYSEIRQALFPLAAGFSAQVDKGMTVFSGRTHRDNLERYYEIISGQLLEPAFREEDFQRVRSNLINYVRVGLRANNDEELGKEVLYEMLYPGHAYGHLTAGHVEAIEQLTLDHVRDFYERNYVQENLMLGLTGDVPQAFRQRVKADLATNLPSGRLMMRPPLVMPEMPQGAQVTLVEKDTRAVAISMGFPIEVTRAHPDFVALWLARSYFGEHRSSNSYLYQRMRALRGMNYGDYAYIEYFPSGMYQFYPSPNLGRHSQIFQLWIRPVPPEQAHFAIRIALFELDRLVTEGISPEAFEATRNYLSKFVNVLVQSQERQLGYALDAWYYDTPEFTQFIRDGLDALTVEDVNAAIRRHLQTENIAIVAVTPDAHELAAALAADTPSPITYNTPMPAEVLEEDAIIETYPLHIDEAAIRVVPADRVFEGRIFDAGD
jgi:zinc protease